MPPTIPPPLAAYITDCLAPPEPVRSRQQRPPRAHTQTLVTSVLETPAPWLLLRLVYAALYGVEDTDDHHQQQRPQQGRRHVIFVSLLRPLGLWVEMGKKMGLDIPSLLKTRRLIYVDGLLTHGSVTTARNSSSGPVSGGGGGGDDAAQQLPMVRLGALDLKGVRETLDDVLKRSFAPSSTSTSTSTSASGSASTMGSRPGLHAPLRTPTITPDARTGPSPRIPTSGAGVGLTSTSTSAPLGPEESSLSSSSTEQPPIILIDGIDFLLAAQSASTVELLSFLATVRAKSHAVILSCQADAPLLHSAYGASSGTGTGTGTTSAETPVERNHAHVLSSLAHSSRRVFQLRGLDTGSAKDVSGVVRVSRGGAVEADDDDDDGDGTDGDGGSDGTNDVVNRRNNATSRSTQNLDDLVDGEWLYQLKGDGSVRVWARGE
ncbi:hypothetical protein HRR83_004343 [Exophiala dermatitidis]|uniref:Uncharacterized protein n=2 Tax=Exophiala dermatitidis TaxID=5970 RepID=H6BQE1_EXODN|nr:uncharacterized protein HMPREF1120_02702 [Exophiala dermatitidis NIH/UT8656]KAJ4511619.1 hypothetical protein HRR73_006194 [Exophiala dermatitidis]EHY54534.1 hypothetical protein HMPREF1120_02702 [Exophiala dermatitidis NIH/UT8656]KAJ4517696.1 hypothetical protein HRR75_002914 [Exophiala dermatitidis]KAJ4521352.1 hypothetical protein HRR74_003175 [Exophiala dermatitidis]KAJ4542022.1 hypothetical protein HRR77_005911 [Exophiala dermatitidis]